MGTIKRIILLGIALGVIVFGGVRLLSPMRLPYPLTPEFPLGEADKVEMFLTDKMFLSGPKSKFDPLPAIKELAKLGKVLEYSRIGDGVSIDSKLPQCIDLVLDRKGKLLALGGVHSSGGSTSVKMVLRAYLALAKRGAIPSGKRKVEVSEWWEGSQRYVTLILR
jgi:hypothetical protein